MQQAFRDAIANSYSREYPFVAYAAPGSFNLTGIFQRDEATHVYSPGDKGFVFAPFSSEAKTLFLPMEDCDLLSTVVEKSIEKDDYKETRVDTGLRQAHIDLVEQAIRRINTTELEKVVVSRKQQVSLANFNLIEILNVLFGTNEHAFRYAWFHPLSGLWIGATPEVLVSVSNDLFKTMSLAGTRSVKSFQQDEWTSKEYHEQQVVTDAIVSELASFSETINISEAHTVRAGSLEHLRSDIEGKLKSEVSPWDLANCLHPTPAVCGSPKDMAMDFILKEEGYDRAYYTGYLGPMSVTEKQTDLFVNLRCMRIADEVATIYTGGGITRDSNPNAEWDETCNKQQTMLKLLRQFL